MRIDLHTHSCVSDGTDRPGALVHLARAAGLDLVALTDHDTYDGWSDAAEAAADAGVQVVPGVEISTQLRGVGVHLLGYLVDPDYAPLAAELARVREDRRHRLERISAQLTRAGLPLDVADIMTTASHASTVGRPHVADAMVAKGYVRNRDEAFAGWLSAGRAGYAPKYAPPTGTAIDLVHAAGGVAVLAHPWGRGSETVLDAATIEALAAGGLDGLEIDHQDHDHAARAGLRRLAAEFDLAVTGSSDYHGTGKIGHELGVNTTAPQQWQRLADRAGSDRSAGARGA